MIWHRGCLAEVRTGDCVESMRAMPEESVQCCVTSPPYFGLRDYGTAIWDGGSPSCGHMGEHASGGSTLGPGKGENSYLAAQKREAELRVTQYRSECKKCGALRIDKQLGMEKTPDEYAAGMVGVFREVWRVLRKDGTLWLNLGDSFAADKNLIGVPWRVAFALQADGWYLRNDIIWAKPSPMPQSVTDRCTASHEHIFLLTKSAKYYYNANAIKTPPSEALVKQVQDGYNGQSTKDYAKGNAQDASGTKARIIDNARKRIDKQRGHCAGSYDLTPDEQMSLGANKRDVWTVATAPFKGSHFATFPPALIEPCLLAGSKPGDILLDPFGGSGTVAGVALKHGRHAILCELNPDYAAMVPARVADILRRK